MLVIFFVTNCGCIIYSVTIKIDLTNFYSVRINENTFAILLYLSALILLLIQLKLVIRFVIGL